MLPIPEVTQWLPQNTPIYLEGRLPLMLPETARQLGLQAGQVVPTVVRVVGERMELWLQGRAIEPPPGWRLTPGETVWLTAHATVNGMWVLRKTTAPSGTSTVEGQLAASAAEDGMEWPAVQQASRMRQLWFHPPGMMGLMQLFRPETLEALMQSPALAQWAKVIMGARLSMGKVTPRDVAQWFKQSLQSTEQAMASGKPVPTQDLKQALAGLLKASTAAPLAGVDAALVQHALDDVEGAQLQAVRAIDQKEVWLSVAIPFVDAPAVHLEVRRERKRDQGGAMRWWINLYTESEQLGQVWMQTGLGLQDGVDMHVWATRAEVVNDARARVNDLRDLLVDAGLKLENFQVILGTKPSSQVPETVPHGSVLDIQA